jgi:hypothetical protein
MRLIAAPRKIERFSGRQGAAAKEWLAAREADLLPVPYYHVVFTLPAAIADIAYQNKAVVYDLMCFWLRPGSGARHIADVVEIGRLAIAHALHLLMDLCHFGLAEARGFADSQRVDIHLRESLHLHSEPKRLFKCLGRYDQAVMA